MLAVRVIPVLLARGRQLVKGERFNGWRSVGHVQQAARIHQARGVDELIILDIAATPEGRGPDIAAIEELTAECFMPLTVGGGVRSVADAEALFRAGADKVAICTGGPRVIEQVASRYGSQAVVAAVDVYDGHALTDCSHCSTGTAAYSWARRCVKAGAGELLLTSIGREGMMKGYDLRLIASIAKRVNIPVIAHGGAGTYDHMLQAVQAGASAVAAGAMFQFTDQTPREAAEYLRDHHIEARV